MIAGFEGSDTYRVEGLEKLLKALHQKPPRARVGIIGSKVARPKGSKGGPTNAEIGAAHEFGAPARGIPQRSFLRMPISNGLQKEMERTGLFEERTLKEVIKTGTTVPWLKKVVSAAEACVADAFDSGGGGSWPAWKNPNYTNNAGQILVDTKQLRESIGSEVTT